MKTIKAKITFVEPILGSTPNNKEIYSEFIASKAPDASTVADEIKEIGVDGVTEKGTTVFPGTMDGHPFVYDYQVKGFFKEACANKRGDKSSYSSKLTNYKKKIDGNVFVYAPDLRPCVGGNNAWKKLFIENPFPMSLNERPLRAQTAQGERISLARSEQIDAGASFTCEIVILLDEMDDVVREWLDYGLYKGLGQWRNAGYGRFVWEEIKDSEGTVG